MTEKFDISITDSQATEVMPVKARNFDFSEYREYTEIRNEQCKEFLDADSGVMVYRRMRVAECFSYGCRDTENSLNLQLGALKESMKYKADVPNFLEPWYGIGTISSAFGGDYTWSPNNAPAIKPRFSTVQEILEHEPSAVSATAIGRHTLEMIEYFMDKTKGFLPVSLTDSQSPLNMVGHLCPMDALFTDMIMEPEKILQLFDLLSDLSVGFNREQLKLIGDSLASPGHGFASSVVWKGLGMSDDNILMISPEQYTEIAVPSVTKTGEMFGGNAFHSCGNWAQWIDEVLKIKNLSVVDGAFSPETDPNPNNDFESFHQFANTGIILNARIVGNVDVIEDKVRKLWIPGMKLIVVTYCKTPEEQAEAYQRIHRICQG